MKSTDESVLESLGANDKDMMPFLNFILQDLWEMGTDPKVVIRMISKHTQNHSKLKVLDLGCGKGAVSVQVAEHFGCKCHGIDAVSEFIDYANSKAAEFEVEHLCKFELGDIRDRILHLPKYDVIVVGAIGPVMGDYLTTINKLNNCLNDNGIIIFDDGYYPDEIDDEISIDEYFAEEIDGSEYVNDVMTRKELLEQINHSGMKIIDEEIVLTEKMNETNAVIFESIKERCNILIGSNPDKSHLFEDYVQSQEKENEEYTTMITCSVIVLKKK
jgi:cyclopropane fatty-acyl-phospholipid synthase-like methyltransferase